VQVADRALELLDELGALYEKDNEKDLKDALSYLPEEAHGVGWLSEGAAHRAWSAESKGKQNVLPAPFKQRPRLGTRRLVSAAFGHIAGALAAELGSWQPENRYRAALLLKVRTASHLGIRFASYMTDALLPVNSLARPQGWQDRWHMLSAPVVISVLRSLGPRLDLDMSDELTMDYRPAAV
jgi:hypothetical protein